MTDPMTRAREMLAAEYARNEMDGEAAYLREGSSASLDEQCAVNVIAALLTREAEVRGEERERLRDLFMLASARIERDVRLSELTDDEIDFLVSAIRDGATGGDHERYRHVKRGTIYEVIGEAELQAATIQPREGNRLVVYRGEDGRMWARLTSEFHDGRFEPAPPAIRGDGMGE